MAASSTVESSPPLNATAKQPCSRGPCRSSAARSRSSKSWEEAPLTRRNVAHFPPVPPRPATAGGQNARSASPELPVPRELRAAGHDELLRGLRLQLAERL